ncbi:MAG TPA: dUTP diphosphatase, partial [Candidatus Nanoarchaeia archaeon]|nr:dUTP diphosphatase [Candidatus Nanoarchaeia archaeon]
MSVDKDWLRVKKLTPSAILPKYANLNDAGMDLYASETIILPPQERKLIPTGIAMAIPPGYAGIIWDKSGLAAKHGIKTMGGVIDAGYRGEIKILVCNLSDTSYTFEKGTKVAQMLIQPVEQNKIVEVKELEETGRGKGGFGSTGIR